jgi:hypothetical protein
MRDVDSGGLRHEIQWKFHACKTPLETGSHAGFLKRLPMSASLLSHGMRADAR